MDLTETGLPGQSLLAVRVCNLDSAAGCQQLGPQWQQAQQLAVTLMLPTWKVLQMAVGPCWETCSGEFMPHLSALEGPL